MNYLESLPSDLLRQTALSLPPETIFKLSRDPKFDRVFTDDFWKEKLKIDFDQDYSSPPIKNSYLYTLENKINNDKRDLLKDGRNKIEEKLVNMQYALNEDKILEEFKEEADKFYNNIKGMNKLIEDIENEMSRVHKEYKEKEKKKIMSYFD